MIYTKGLVLKGLLGFGATSSAVYVGLSQKERIAGWFSGNEEASKPAEITDDLPGKVELNCPPATAEGVNCSKKTGEGAGNIKVKKGDVTFDVSNLPSSDGSGKIKLYKLTGADANDYNQGLKFVIEDGDISASTGDNKLEEFETYEIKEDGSDWKLTLKKKSSEEKRRILGLPDSCTLPESNSPSSCNNLTTEQINNIKFDGKEGDVTGTGTLQITVATSSDAGFPLGFKFTLTAASSDGITINRGSAGNIVLKNNEGTDFRIKKVGKNLTLEEALTKDALTKKVGLQCQGEVSATGVNCTKVSGTNIKVKQNNSSFDVTTDLPSSGGKIKLYKAEGAEDYNGGFKFVIEDGDISVNSGSSNKLEEFETYEIKKDGTDWKLTRKKKSWEEKRRILGLPQDSSCTFPEGASGSANCTINATNVSSINFDGKTGVSLGGGSATLKVEVTPSTETTEFPLGYKFTLTPTGGTLTINRSSGDITLNDGATKKFKIKQDAQNKKQLTLEEAWTLTTLASKVNLSCTASGSTTLSEETGIECTKTGSSEIKVKKDTADLKVSNITQGKIKVYKTSSGETHNEGFKFVIEENDITATNGSGSNKLEQFETYEIKKEGSDWKLVKKTDAKDGIKKALGLDECTFPANGAEQECALDESKFKKINFDGKSVNDMTGGNSAKLKISKPSNNNDYGSFGYKFKLESEQEAKISSSLTIKANTNTEFKIKKGTGNSITLEKAWTAKSLGEKVGLNCSEDNAGTKECTLKDGNVVNIDNGESNKKFTSLSKKSNGDGGEKKVKFEVGEAKYNQGFKFTTESEICLQNGNGGSDDDKKIEAKGGSSSEVSYEIKEDNGTWYLTKKNSGA